MSSITISHLQPAGLNLFSDSEGYLNDLTEMEQTIQGGLYQVSGTPVLFTYSVGMGAIFSSGVAIGYLGAAAYHDYTHISI
jgi:hypothetical protein